MKLKLVEMKSEATAMAAREAVYLDADVRHFQRELDGHFALSPPPDVVSPDARADPLFDFCGEASDARETYVAYRLAGVPRGFELAAPGRPPRAPDPDPPRGRGRSSMELWHTYTPPAARGRGLAARVVREALRWAEHNGLRVVPSCSYVERACRKRGRGVPEMDGDARPETPAQPLTAELAKTLTLEQMREKYNYADVKFVKSLMSRKGITECADWSAPVKTIKPVDMISPEFARMHTLEQMRELFNYDDESDVRRLMSRKGITEAADWSKRTGQRLDWSKTIKPVDILTLPILARP
jgi:GNAT superfamily N-acetyltransferase